MQKTSLFSPKQIAEALQVSESSVKRWCDAGTIESTKTAGGHRKIPLVGFMAFVKSHRCRVYRPEILGIDVRDPHAVETRKDPGGDQNSEHSFFLQDSGFVSSLARGDIDACRQLLAQRALELGSNWRAAEELITSSLCRVGEAWECGALEVYQERRACEICLRLIQELNAKVAVPPDRGLIAIGAAVEGDPYQLPTLMVEMLLRELGWQATSLGNNLPLSSLALAVREYSPRLVWVSISTISDLPRFVEEFNRFAADIGPEVVLVVGGRALTDAVRPSLQYSAYCDRLHQVADLATRLAN